MTKKKKNVLKNAFNCICFVYNSWNFIIKYYGMRNRIALALYNIDLVLIDQSIIFLNKTFVHQS